MASSDSSIPYSIPKSDIPLSSALSPGYSFGGAPSLPTTPTPSTKTTPTTTPDTSGSSLAGALTAGDTAALLGYQANKQTDQAAGQLQKSATAAGGAGQQYLAEALGGKLTPAQQATYDTLKKQSETLSQQAEPYLAAGAQGLQAYEQGQLPAWQQTQLDNQTAAAIAQARASMGANVDSSSMAQIEAQIRQQATIAKGQMLQNNLITSQELAQYGLTEQKDAFALMDAANTSVTSSLQQSFTNAMDALGIADNATLREIQARISGNSAVGNSVSSLLGNLTKAYTLSAAQDSNGSVTDAIKKLFGMDYTPSYVTSGQYGKDVSTWEYLHPLEGTSTAAPADWLASQGLGTDTSVSSDANFDALLDQYSGGG